MQLKAGFMIRQEASAQLLLVIPIRGLDLLTID